MISGKIADHDYPVITVEEWKRRNEERIKAIEQEDMDRIRRIGTTLERKRLAAMLKKEKKKKNKSA